MAVTPQEQRSMRASVALNAAVEATPYDGASEDEHPANVLKVADKFYDWLAEKSGNIVDGEAKVSAAQGTANAEKAFSGTATGGAEGETCPQCNSGTLARKDKKSGKGSFVGCDSFPACDYIVRDKR